jgi:AraC-like DNA-binding protein
MKSKPPSEPHLIVHEASLPCGGEWTPRFRGWCTLLFSSGIGYFWDQANAMREVAPGSVLVIGGEFGGHFRASQLSEVIIQYFCVEPEKLGGVLPLREQIALTKAAEQPGLSARMLPPNDPTAQRLRNILEKQGDGGVSTRLQLLELFIGLFECEIKDLPAKAASWDDGRGRLKQLLKQMAAEEFLELKCSDLAPQMNCSPRHLRRLFQKEVGASFRRKQTELRLAKASELLATSNAKVVDVALISGYRSNGLFGRLFKKHFGLPPRQWREQQQRYKSAQPKSNRTLAA